MSKAIISALSVLGSGVNGLANLVTRPNHTNPYARQSFAIRNRTPNKSAKRTYRFVRRVTGFDRQTNLAEGWFECLQTGELSVRKVKILNACPKALDFYK